MSKTFQTRIKHKRDSQANWETNNPILLEGELGIVVMPDGKIKTKVGDGVTNYNLLPFSSSDVELTWENIENKPENLIISSDDSIQIDVIDPYVRTDKEQIFTEEEKAQARTNIGTLSADEITALINQNITSSVENAIGGSY